MSAVMKKIGDYELLEVIGSGSFADVYRARRGSEFFAIKVMKGEWSGKRGEEVLARMRYEFWVLKDIKHPNIVALYDFGSLPDGRIYLVEELFSGVDLKAYCSAHGFTDCVKILVGLLSALAEIHAWRLIHGDIKVGNILVAETSQGLQAKILDFGLAHGEDLVAKTEGKAVVCGTPSTMAPEIILGQEATEKSDLYSFGVTLYEALTGKNPFLRRLVADTLNAHLNFTPEPIGLTRSDIPPAWQELIEQLLCKDPELRLAHAAQGLELVGDLRGFFLHETPFVGRAAELSLVDDVLEAIEKGERLSIVARGDEGVGVHRFVRELFYRILNKDPKCRAHVGFEGGGTTSPTVLLLTRAEPPSSHPSKSVTIKTFSKEEVLTWLELIFKVSVPTVFLDKVFGLTEGRPKMIWELLTRLNEQRLLIDATGVVTRSTLSLIDWQRLTKATGDELKLEFSLDGLLIQLKSHLRKRENILVLPQWGKAQKLIALIENPTQRLRSRAQLLCLKGAAHIDQSQFEEAKLDLKTALEIFAHDSSCVMDKIRTQNYLAYVFLRQGQVAQAISLYEESQREMVEKLTPAEIRQITNLNLGMAYLKAGRAEEAVTSLTELLKVYQESNEISLQLNCLYYLAQAHLDLKSYVQAKQSFHSMQLLARQVHDPAYVLRAVNGLGNALSLQGETVKAIETYGEALEVALALSDYTAAAVAVQNRGILRVERLDSETALKDFLLSLDYIRRVGRHYPYEKQVVVRSHVQLCHLLIKLKRFDEAKDNADQAWRLSEKDDELKFLRFWILEAKCALHATLAEWDAFKQNLALLKYYVEGPQQQSRLDKLLETYGTLKSSAEQSRTQDVVVKAKSPFDQLLTITRDLVSELNLDDLLKKILEYAVELSRSEFAVLLLPDDRGRLTPRLSLNAELNKDLSGLSLSVANEALATGQVVACADALHDERFNQNASVMAMGLKSILGVPVKFKGKVLGVLYLSHSYQHGLYTGEVMPVIMAFADQVGLALKNHELLNFYKEAKAELTSELAHTQADLTLMREQLKTEQRHLDILVGGEKFLTASAQMMQVLEQAERLASTTISIIIHGESGSGKEVLARYIHQRSARRDKPYVAINCGAIPATLVESELFGHRKGAFTGAERDRVGLIEAAHGGTLFLDEITDLPLATQVKFLRFLQEREITRLGDTTPRVVDVRVIAASHKNLRFAVEKKEFRDDLYYRLAGMEMTVPPLRERQEDIGLLTDHFLEKFRQQFGRKNPQAVAASLRKIFNDYAWPGNIRELKNVIIAAASLCDHKKLSEHDLPQFLSERLLARNLPVKAWGDSQMGVVGFFDPQKTWQEHEVAIFAAALIKFDFDVPQVATNLGVGVATVYRKLKLHRIADLRAQWEGKTPAYSSGQTLDSLRRFVFTKALAHNGGSPYAAALALAVAPVTVYRYAREGENT